MDKMWAGRFQKALDKEADDFNSSIHFDCRMFRQDIEGSIAHAAMLARQGILSAQEGEALIAGLGEILQDLDSGKLTFDPAAEDIHMFVESVLTERLGDVGKKLHTARSRNDQVALDIRLYLRGEVKEILTRTDGLLDALLGQAKAHADTIMPGYTHLQRAQPITFGHHLLAYCMMLLRDEGRLEDAARRMNQSPLGCCALAGTTYPTDRESAARDLGFDGITLNSLDGVSDRDFCLEILSACSILMMHLSRLAEEVILWASWEFKFVELDDAYTTGSSIMPQKKNPDMAELARGKTGRVYGDLMALLTVLKGLPLAYNKDMQEDKEALFDARDTLVKSLVVFNAMLAACTFNTSNMERGAAGGFTNATDAADYLVKKGMPFRDAHAVIGRLVLHCVKENKAILDLSLDELREFSALFDEDVFEACSMRACVELRDVPGGPAPGRVQDAIDAGQAWLEAFAF